jgi:hypothetical protein
MKDSQMQRSIWHFHDSVITNAETNCVLFITDRMSVKSQIREKLGISENQKVSPQVTMCNHDDRDTVSPTNAWAAVVRRADY